MGKLASNIAGQAKFNLLEPMTSIGKTEDFPYQKNVSAGQNGSFVQAQSLELYSGNVQKEEEGIREAAVGKKRDARGNSRKGKDDRALLLKEILALGGTEDDLDLITGMASDEDGTTGGRTRVSITDGKFAMELSRFVTSLGIEGDFNARTAAANLDEDGKSTAGLDKPEKNLYTDGLIRKFPTSTPREDINVEGHSKALNHLIFDTRPDWHTAALPSLPAPDVSDTTPFQESIAELRKYALSLLQSDGNIYNSKYLSSASSHRFLSTIMSTGTLSDKVSALTLVVQESPVHTSKSLDILITLAKKRSRGQAVIALGAIKDLLGTGIVLPADRRLYQFGSQPGLLGALQRDTVTSWKQGCPLPGGITKAHMISWAYEDWLKDAYFEVLKILESWCNDEVEFARSRAIAYVYELLREKPEQESNLLRLLVNKLGDPDRKIASRTSYLILQLQTTHPLMKTIIIRAIENEVLRRPGQSAHAKYYAVNTLNQTILSGKEEGVARKLLDIYFDLFVTLIKKNTTNSIAVPQVNRKGQLQGGGGQVGEKAEARAVRETAVSKGISEKLISAILTGVNRALPFANSDDTTLQTHVDTLFNVTHSSNFNTSIRALMLIQLLTTSKNIAVDRFYRTLYESLFDPRLASSSKHVMFLNLLFRALKSDRNIKRVKAFAKRLVQVITLHQPPFICGVLYLLRELEATFPSLNSLLEDPEEYDDGDEVFSDLPEGVTTFSFQAQSSRDISALTQKGFSVEAIETPYNGRKRDPKYSNAEKSCLWELLPFVAHFHPSVSIFASHLLAGREAPAKPNLASHTLIHFLDKFVYRNAKVAVGGFRGTSIMQPSAASDSKGVLVSNQLAQCRHESLNSESFWRKKVDNVAVDEVFFHNYFSQIGKGNGASEKRDKSMRRGENNRGDGDGDKNEDEIWRALVGSQPEVEGYSTDDGDIELLDLDHTSDGASSASDLGIEAENNEVAGIGDFGGALVSSGVGEYHTNDLFTRELRKQQSGNISAARTEETSSKRRRLKNLPTFASVEDYAEMLGEDEENI